MAFVNPPVATFVLLLFLLAPRGITDIIELVLEISPYDFLCDDEAGKQTHFNNRIMKL